MIRRDYFMRLVQELMQTLQRIRFLRQRQEYDQALQEIERSLTHFWDLSPEQLRQLSLENWIDLCSEGEGPVGEKLVALADLFREEGDLHALEEHPDQGQKSRALALGLYLETLSTSMVSMDLIEKVEELIEQTREGPLPAGLAKRLLLYFEARGRFARAEDILFDWVQTADSDAREHGVAFYDRLLAKSDEELEQGDLPRTEVEQGRRELLQ